MRLALVTGLREAVEGFTAVAEHREWLTHSTAIFAIPRMDFAKRMARIWTLTLEEICGGHVFLRVGASVHCWCGERLHYEYPHVQLSMEKVCHEKGEWATIVVPRGVYRVPRHYIALHGLDYERLHEYGFEQAEPKNFKLGDLRRPFVPADCGTF